MNDSFDFSSEADLIKEIENIDLGCDETNSFFAEEPEKIIQSKPKKENNPTEHQKKRRPPIKIHFPPINLDALLENNEKDGNCGGNVNNGEKVSPRTGNINTNLNVGYNQKMKSGGGYGEKISPRVENLCFENTGYSSPRATVTDTALSLLEVRAMNYLNSSFQKLKEDLVKEINESFENNTTMKTAIDTFLFTFMTELRNEIKFLPSKPSKLNTPLNSPRISPKISPSYSTPITTINSPCDFSNHSSPLETLINNFEMPEIDFDFKLKTNSINKISTFDVHPLINRVMEAKSSLKHSIEQSLETLREEIADRNENVNENSKRKSVLRRRIEKLKEKEFKVESIMNDQNTQKLHLEHCRRLLNQRIENFEANITKQDYERQEIEKIQEEVKLIAEEINGSKFDSHKNRVLNRVKYLRNESEEVLQYGGAISAATTILYETSFNLNGVRSNIGHNRHVPLNINQDIIQRDSYSAPYSPRSVMSQRSNSNDNNIQSTRFYSDDPIRRRMGHFTNSNKRAPNTSEDLHSYEENEYESDLSGLVLDNRFQIKLPHFV
ncbi:hypothetical protein TRFO_25602 [Tritrichomonas foetus]|uniref:Uncharacterized protein n=1 Tax=Tritrichomonas foetus TaxID=1144522 RepID=A0A1J4K9G1_9EUKA|nr:hypothetical protein TRFO_25602 [Tritrichomonas foetus]|eukprot:OHT06332.1 hypothetical protein TRFO_25602 [Tritrichomonas foetus]